MTRRCCYRSRCRSRFSRIPSNTPSTTSSIITIGLSVFESKYHNDQTGAPAIDPGILLKVILLAYSRGVVAGRRIAQCCYAEGLIGKRMFAVDGCKISSNCSKEWSGSRKELLKKAEKIEQSVRFLLKRHREEDGQEAEPGQREKEQKAVENLQAEAEKIRMWL